MKTKYGYTNSGYGHNKVKHILWQDLYLKSLCHGTEIIDEIVEGSEEDQRRVCGRCEIRMHTLETQHPKSLPGPFWEHP